MVSDDELLMYYPSLDSNSLRACESAQSFKAQPCPASSILDECIRLVDLTLSRVTLLSSRLLVAQDRPRGAKMRPGTNEATMWHVRTQSSPGLLHRKAPVRH